MNAPANPSALPIPSWLSPQDAAAYLGVSISDLLPLVEASQLHLHRAPDQGLRFHRDDLDAVLLPISSSEAVRLLSAEASTSPEITMTTPKTPSSPTTTTGTLVSLKDAAVQLQQPYKSLLRLVHAGKLPVTNLGTSSRPRFMVDPDAIKRRWEELAQRDMRRRSAPVGTVDFSRLLNQPTKGSKVVHRG